LKPTQVEALGAGYEAGKTMKQLAVEFNINRLTVSRHLRRAGVQIRVAGLDETKLVEASHLYESGWSSGRLAEHYDVSADTVLKALRHAGVAIRPRRGRPKRAPHPS
jgi:DNA-binding transcriptional regulator LsrR (DeoR family)